MFTAEIPPATAETDGDDCVTFTCETCADERDDGTVWVSGYQFDPDGDETVAEFALSVLIQLTGDYENHWLTDHAS